MTPIAWVRCRTCNREFPIAACRVGRRGYNRYCSKQCKDLFLKPAFKECSRCKRVLPRSEFYQSITKARPNPVTGGLCKPCNNINSGIRRKERPDRGAVYGKRMVQKWRLTCLNAYGGKCVCCGEIRPEFLCLDHINDDGAEDRKKHGRTHTFYRYLIKAGFPPYIRVLCHNCNMGRAFYGECPHVSEKIAA